MVKRVLLVGVFWLITFFPHLVLGQCGCDFTINAGQGSVTFDGAANGVKPGDVVCLQAGLRGRIIFQNLNGAAGNYITIKNCGGKAEVGGASSNNGIAFYGSRYFRLTGTGAAGIDYGIKIVETSAGSQGIVCAALSSDFEIDHIEVQKTGFAGIMAKTDPSCDDASVRPNFRMSNVKIHDNYFHDISGEGIYLGNSFYSGTSQYCGRMQYCHEVRGVRIYNNIIDGSGWEAIQVGAAVSDVEVYNNRVYNYGRQNRSSQNGGIQLGLGSTGRVYNNFIKNGTGPGFWIQGIGNLYFYNNVVVNPGLEAFNVNVRPTPLSTDIVPTGFLGGIYILNNTVVSASYAAVKENINAAPGNMFVNNLIVNSTSNWNQLKTYTDWEQKNNVVLQSLNDARFVNPGADDYSLQPSSPAVDAGIDLRSRGVTIDHNYTSRPSGTAFDVGAFELAGGSPKCNAGGDKSITLPVNTVVLNGSASSPNGSIVSYVWTKKSGGAATLQNATTPTLTITGLAAGVYEFQLEVTDNTGRKASAIAKVTVLAAVNQSPTANAGANQTVTLPTNSITLSGSGFDPDGTIVKYEWEKVSGPDVVLNGASSANLQLTELLKGEYNFELTVTDDGGATDVATVKVTVNPAAVNQVPAVNAGQDVVIYLPVNTLNVSAQASDPDGSIASYLWEKRSGGYATIVNGTGATATLQDLVAGVYVFRVTVRDNQGAAAFDEVQVTVIEANRPPSASAGNNVVITLPQNSVTLTGSGMDADGTISKYSWSKVTSLDANIVSPAQATTVIEQLVQGVHKFGLTVTDDDGATAYDEVTVTVNSAPVNKPPVVSAGPDKSIQLPANTITLAGSARDTDGTIVFQQWTKLSGPAATLVDPGSLSLQIADLEAGTYVFRLTVRDNANATASDNVQVVVFPASVNQPPIANAGGNRTISLPTNSIELTGAGSDPDGAVVAFTWTLENGPTATLNANDNVLSVSDMTEGIYVFKLTVTDDNGATNSDFSTVGVVAANLAPIINEAEDQTIKLPETTTTITAVAHDPDGSIALYSWTQTAGKPATLSNTSTKTLSISDLDVGDYMFQVSVTDNNGSTSSAVWNVKVQAAASNMPPVATAGTDVSIFLPVSTVTLNGSGVDPDGTVASYSWTRLSGSGVISSPAAASTQIRDLTVGVHRYRLTVTDNSGDVDTDDIEVTVNPAPSNRPPIVSAGGNKNIQLPTSTVTLSGNASDADGSITTYAWTKISGPEARIVNSTRATTVVDRLVEGKYVFRLRATDDKGASAFDEVIVTVLPVGLNEAPRVNAGTNQSIVLPTNLTHLIAVASDPDGSIQRYLWTKQSGPAVVLRNETTPIATLDGLTEGVYVFRVVVTDDKGASSYDNVEVRVSPANTNVPPVANAGGNQSIVLPTNSINLFGSGTDQDGQIVSYEWVKVSGGAASLEDQRNPVLTVKGLEVGTYTFRLRVTDDKGATNQDAVSVVVSPQTVNLPPIVQAGIDQTIYLPNNTTSLVGDAIDLDGEIIEFEWSQQSGEPIQIRPTTDKNPLLVGLTAGTYTFRMSATDDDGATAYDDITVTVLAIPNNQPPKVNAGPDLQLFLPLATFTIKGSASDPDGTIRSYLWTKVQGPSVTMTNTDSPSLTISDFVAGKYRFRLKVLDNGSRGTTDDAIVTVMPEAVIRAPVVSLESSAEVTLPQNEISISASANDEDGTIVSVSWTQISGAPATLSGTDSQTLHVSDLAEGTYTFLFTAQDNQGAEASAQIKVTVKPIPRNQAPVVEAGPNQNIVLPVAVILEGTVSDADGEVKEVSWAQVEGPATVLKDASVLSTSTTELITEGIYVFRLSATDDMDAVGYDDVIIYVQSPEQVIDPNADILSFSVPDQTSSSKIDTVLNVVSLSAMMPGGSTVLTPSFTLSPGASAKVFGIRQVSGVSQQDFAGPVKYVVVASDSLTEKVWTVEIEETQDGPDAAPVAGGQLVYPLFFSPNGDGHNDTWTIVNFDSIGTCTLEVFSRNGQLVYKNQQFENHWDGTSNSRVLVSADYYFLLSKQGKRIAAGSFRIIR